MFLTLSLSLLSFPLLWNVLLVNVLVVALVLMRQRTEGVEGCKKKRKEKLIKLNTKQTEKRSPFDCFPRNNPHSVNFLPTVPFIPLDTVFISIFISMAWYGTWHGTYFSPVPLSSLPPSLHHS